MSHCYAFLTLPLPPEALEWQLDSRGGVSDPAATALLQERLLECGRFESQTQAEMCSAQDAMDFADELLEQHSDMWTDACLGIATRRALEQQLC